MLATAVLLSVIAFGPDRDVATPIAGPNPGVTGIATWVARPQGGYFVIYQDGRRPPITGDLVGLRGARVNAALDVADPTGVPIPSPPGLTYVSAAHDGQGIIVAQAEHDFGNIFRVNVVRIAENGAVLFPLKAVTAVSNEIVGLAVAHDGGRTVVAWIEEGNTGSFVRAAAISATGAITGPWTLASETGYSIGGVTASCSGTQTLIAWSVFRSAMATDLEGIKLGVGQTPPAMATPLHTQLGLGWPVATALPGGAWYLAWYEGGGGTVSLKGAKLPATGALGSAVTIDSLSSQYAIGGRLAFDGTHVRAVWTTYLDVRSRTVPADGAAPTSPVQTLRSALPFAPGADVLCSGSDCAVSWHENAASGAFGGNAFVSRLSDTGTALDLPPKEVSFPADEQGKARFIFDGQAQAVLFERKIGRDDKELMFRRLNNAGAWLDAQPRVLTKARQWVAAADVPGGGVLIAETIDGFSGSDDTIFGQRIDASGAVIDAGVWVVPNNRPSDVHLACATTHCGLLYEQSQGGYLGARLSTQGALLEESNLYLSVLDQAQTLTLTAAADHLVALFSHGGPARAIIAPSATFPTFGAPIDLSPSGVVSAGKVQGAASGTTLAAAFGEKDSCRVRGRLLDTTAGSVTGPLITVHDCGAQNTVTGVLSVINRPGGFSVFFVDQTTIPNGGYQFDYLVQDTDAALNPIGSARLADRRDSYGFEPAFSQIAGRDAFVYPRFDDSPGVLSTRIKLAGIDDGGTVMDAGALIDAGTVDAGNADAGTVDSGVADAGAIADAGMIDAGLPTDGGHSADTEVKSPDSTLGPPVGCGCGSSGFEPVLLALGILALARRRR